MIALLAPLLGAVLVGASLGLLGSGGSILTVPILVFLIGHPEKSAIAESLAIVAVIAAVGAASSTVLKQVHWRSVTWCCVATREARCRRWLSISRDWSSVSSTVRWP